MAFFIKTPVIWIFRLANQTVHVLEVRHMLMQDVPMKILAVNQSIFQDDDIGAKTT